jgi:hypothetical protein
MVPPHQRTGLQPTALAMASPNPYTPLGEDEVLDLREEADVAAPPPGPTNPWAPTHGWDLFVNSLDANAQQELGVVDDILISYANFAGDAFSMYNVDSARIMDRIIALEDALEYDHDEVVQTRDALSKLDDIVLANANGISDIQTMMKENATMMRENMSNVAALQEIVDDTSSQVKTMAEALREVTETANNAFRLALGPQPTIIGHGVKLDALVEDVSQMSSDIDGLRVSYASPTDHTTKLALLEGTVSQIGSEFVELCKLMEAQSGSNMAGDSQTMPTTDTSASRDSVGRDHAQRTSSWEMDDVHSLFPNADPAYRTPCEPQIPERAHATPQQDEINSSHDEDGGSVGGSAPPRQAAQGSCLESRRTSFRPVPPLQTSYRVTSHAPPRSFGNMRQHMEDSCRDNNGQYDDDDASLGGMIVSPRNAD